VSQVDVSAELERARSALRAARAGMAGVDLSWLGSLPSGDAWTLAPDALRFLYRLVLTLAPRHVVELGSGLSTCVLARAAAEGNLPCAVSVVEHDPAFRQITARKLERYGLTSAVRFHLAPLVARKCLDRTVPMYELGPGGLASYLPADVVLIDGPPSVLGGREGTLYQVMDFARPGTLVLLDDAGRAEEQSALARWRNHFDRAIEVALLPGFTRGLAAILIERPVPMSELWAHAAALAASEIAALVPPTDAFILVDQGQWAVDFGPRHAIPFAERNGAYGGPPPDDAAAIAEVERSRAAGARFIAFGSPALWWLDHYAGFASYLRSRFTCVRETDRLVVFDLRA
jgi:predicted O-methyltransferase YrrM